MPRISLEKRFFVKGLEPLWLSRDNLDMGTSRRYTGGNLSMDERITEKKMRNAIGWVFGLVLGAFVGVNFARAEQPPVTVVEVSAKFTCVIAPSGESTPESRVKGVRTVAQTPSGQALSLEVVCDNGKAATFKAASGKYLIQQSGSNWVRLSAVDFAPLLAQRN